VWARRLKETFAILTVGDGIIEVIFPTEHSLRWEFGPAKVRKVARFFAENPNLMRLLGTAQVAFGIWLAQRRYHER
jgi:hypothetical protein